MQIEIYGAAHVIESGVEISALGDEIELDRQPIDVNKGMQLLATSNLTWAHQDVGEEDCDWFVEYDGESFGFDDIPSFQEFLRTII